MCHPYASQYLYSCKLFSQSNPGLQLQNRIFMLTISAIFDIDPVFQLQILLWFDYGPDLSAVKHAGLNWRIGW